LEKVGVLDPRYFGFFGDIDFGLRVQRAGLKLVCAKGAWILHEGAAHFKLETIRGEPGLVYAAQKKVVFDAYSAFRNKWNMRLPESYPNASKIDFPLLRASPSPAGGEFQPRITPGPEICQMLEE
jgi:hypothetical protein